MAYETEAEWKAAQPDLTKITNPMEQRVALESWQMQRPGYVNPMDFNNYESYAGAAGIQSGKDAGNDLTNRANFYGMTIENYQNALSGDPTKPMGGNQAVYGSQLLSPLEQRAAEAARGQGIASTTLSPEMQALAQKYPNYFVDYAKQNPDVFNTASQRFQNYMATTYPGTLEYENVLSGPMQFSSTGVKYPETKDTVNMYILDRRTGQIIKNPNYKPPVRKAEGGLMSVADHMASKGRGPDSMLIHMSPREVQGLQALAMKNGGSLTINPETGLPEAGFLDKLLPTIIGAGLTFFGGVPPHIAAMMVGGVETVRTGDLGRGISAGLGAYGGANLTAGLTEAGASTIGATEAAKGLTMSPELIAEFGGDLERGISAKDLLLQQQVADKVAAATPYDKLSAGFDAFGKNPMGMAKSLAMPAAMAFGPAILAGANVQAKGPQTTTKPGMIRPYSFDPYGGTYTAGTPYEATPIKPAAHGGLMGLAAGGMTGYEDDEEGMATGGMGGMFNFAQQSEPVVRMAGGGVVALAGGGDYRSLTKDSSADDIASAYKQFTTASGGDTAANQKAAIDYLTNLGIGQDKIGQAYGTYQASPTYTDYTPEQMGSFLSNPVNKNINLDKAIIDTNANPYAVNQYIAKIDDPFRDATLDTRGSGTFGIFNNMITQGIDPNELRAANIALDPAYATKGWTADKITNAYNLTKGANELSAVKQGKTTDTDWAKLMVGNGTWDKPQYSVNDMAQVSGLSINEVNARYELEKAKAKAAAVTPPPTVVKPPITNTTPITYNTAGTNAPGGLESILGLPPGVSGAGVTTVNPNGTITTRPDIPGIGDGFTGMKDVRDTYEEGGGSLGVNKNLFAPTTTKQIEDRYKLTGGSKQSYDYLMGKTPYSPTPYTPTGEIMKPYLESVGRAPVNLKTKRYIYDPEARIYKENPAYIKPSYVLAGEKAAADKAAAKETTKANVSAGKSINVLDNQGNTEPAYLRDDGFYYTSGGTKFDEKGTQVVANGGLMAMARGGMAQQFSLGDYSDGGRLLRGPGDGVSDSIPASIGGKRPARLADGEFVVPARIVSELGNGSTEAGARKLYAMMDRIQKARRGTVGKGRVAKNSRSEKYLPA